ncbi:MAG: hypothetical protein JO023_24475 [Chloroflexi bacterium]|nr:hypothetical protein [Chloroflexota bacterium]
MAERNTGPQARSLSELLAGLPAEASEYALFPELQRAVASARKPLVVIDDDPTGTQTVYDTPVFLEWSAADIARAVRSEERLFYLLTNSRSMPSADASSFNEAIGRDLAGAGADVAVASRSDSTLRGHYPAEILALAQGLDQPIDGHLLVPAFFEGGRYTIDDTHWVATPAASSLEVIPASATPFARDSAFGYSTAYLPRWVEEKSQGRWTADQVRSVSLATIRQGPEAVTTALMDVGGAAPVIVNSASYGDMATFVLGLLAAEARGKRFLYRTAASFVRVRAGLAARPLLSMPELFGALPGGAAEAGRHQGLVVVGSYVPASTAQLERLLATHELPLRSIEVDVAAAVDGSLSVEALGDQVDTALAEGQLPVVWTSRRLVTAEGEASLAIGRRVTDALLEALARVTVRPRFVIAKGGITSHEVARRGLGAKRATALGQIQPGVPVWRLEGRPEEVRFSGVPYVVFPGNVGSPESILQAAIQLTYPQLDPP